MKIILSYEEAIENLKKIFPSCEITVLRKKTKAPPILPEPCRLALNLIAAYFDGEYVKPEKKILFIKELRTIFTHLGLADAKYLSEITKTVLVKNFSKGKVPYNNGIGVFDWRYIS